MEKGDSGFCLPYEMEKGKMKDPATGNSYSVKMQFNSEEQWTKVLIGWAGSRGSSSLEKKWNSS